MKKKKLIASLLIASAALGLASCGGKNDETDNPDDGQQQQQTYTVTFNTQGGSSIANATTNASGKVTKPADPTKSGYAFGGWYTDIACTNAFDFNVAVTANTTLYAKWTAGVEYEEVTYKLVDSDFVIGTSSEDMIINNFTIKAGAEMRSRSKTWTNPDDSTDIKSFTQSLKLAATPNLTVTAPGNGKLSIWIQNGSSGADTQYITFGKAGETAEQISFAGNSSGSPVVKLEFDVEEGCTYEIGRPSGTVDLYYAELVCSVEKSEIVGFEIVSNGVVNYLPGQSYDSSKVILNAVYGNGRTEVIDINSSDVTIDSSSFDANTAGIYNISVKYKDYAAQTIEAAVYAIDSLVLGFNKTEKLAQNSQAGNGVYFNQTVQRIYALNATELETKDLTISVLAVHPTDSTSTMEFVVNTSECNITGFDTTTAGEKTITVAYGSFEVTYDIWVVDIAPSVVNEVVQLKVDQSYDGTIGAVSDGYNMFTSIQQALDYLEISDIDASVKKELHVAAGLYNEKIEITVPYLSIIGEDKETTTIEWDSLYGIEDEGGFSQITDSTQTVAIRDTAVGCVIENITISNYWNSLERFDDKLGAGYQEHRALAILIQADQFKMNNCKLLGYQDTIELFTGRQLIENTYICGTTDFIFGTNNTTYFKDCTIHSITAEQNRGDKTDGGYITAFKGCNKGSSDYVEYGVIFDGCNFTADDEVLADGNTAIARTWGAYAAVMVMNSTLGSHISTAENTTGTAGKNVRYVSMNNVNVATTGTLKFFEYNNTGAGAITESQTGCTVLTDATEAAKYADYSIIFGTTNGLVNYTLPWDPTSNEIAQDPNVYYFFNGGTSTTGTVYSGENQDTNALGEDFTIGDISFNKGTGRIYHRGSDLMVTNGATITFTVGAGTLVTVNSYPGYYYYTINGVEAGGDCVKQYYTEETEITIASTGSTFYLYSIILNNEAEPLEVEVSSLKVTGITTDYGVGDSFDASGLKVKAVYNNNTIQTLTDTDYTLNLDAVDFTTAGTYDASITYEGVSYDFKVNVTAEVTTYIEGSLTVSFKDDTANASSTYLVYDDSAIDGSLQIGKFTIVDNGQGVVANNGDWLKFNTGAKVEFEVATAATLTISFYQDKNNVKVTVDDVEITVNGDGTYTLPAGAVVIEAIDNGYLGKVSVEAGYVLSDSCTVSFKDDTANASSTYLVYDDSAIDGSLQIGKFTIVDNGQGVVANNGDWLKFNTGAKIVFNTLRKGTLTISFYNDKNNVKVTVDDVEITVNGDGTYTLPAGAVVIEAIDNGYVGKVTVELENPPLTETTGFTFKGSSYSGTNVINCNNSETGYVIESTDTVVIENVTFSGVKTNGNDNWLKFNSGATITFSVSGPCYLNIYFYNGSNNATVALDGTEVTTTTSSEGATYTTAYVYEISEAGTVTITSTADGGYLGYFEVVFDE